LLDSHAQQLANETLLGQQLEFTFNEYLVKVSSISKTTNLEINKAQLA
jgi:hypothetical protein